MSRDIELGCPVPFSAYPRVVLAHGGGGRVMRRLIDELFAAAFGPVAGHDGAVVELSGATAITTDGFTVSPLFFPGGDIGRLAVCGTVNDLAVCGARPRYLTCAFVLEEGLALADLERVVESMARAAAEAGVSIVTGDTKVVERGKGDGVYITTTGVGELLVDRPPTAAEVVVGDAVLVSGPVGDHGVAVMAEREGIRLLEPLQSDVASIHRQIAALYDAGVAVRFLRDPTRGGLATVAAELASGSGACVHLDESAIPIRPAVADCCELLGLDPLYVACEGRFVAVVASADRDRALGVLDRAGGEGAAAIGEIRASPKGTAVLENGIGGERVLDLLSGEQLPRIC